MNLLGVLAVVLSAFFLFAFYLALRQPNGRVFPSRREKLLRVKRATLPGHLAGVSVRFFSRAGGVNRVMLNARYTYQRNGEAYDLTLPLESGKLAMPAIVQAETTPTPTHEDASRVVEMPTQLELQDGTRLVGLPAIEAFFLERVRFERPVVDVTFDRKSPALSTVRDWR